MTLENRVRNSYTHFVGMRRVPGPQTLAQHRWGTNSGRGCRRFTRAIDEAVELTGDRPHFHLKGHGVLPGQGTLEGVHGACDIGQREESKKRAKNWSRFPKCLILFAAG